MKKKKFTPLCKELGTKFAKRFEEIKNQKNRIAREEKIIQDDANAQYRILKIEKERIEAEANLRLSRIR